VQFSKRFPAGSRCAKWCSVIFSLNLFLIGSSALYAQNVWVGQGTSSWFTPGNWTLGVPTNTQSALVDNGSIATIVEATNAVAATLTIGPTIPGSTVQLDAGGILTLTNPLVIGPDGTVRFDSGTVFTPAFRNNGIMVFEGQGNRFLSADTTGSGTVIIDITGTLSMS
jgi:hypothetical protein